MEVNVGKRRLLLVFSLLLMSMLFIAGCNSKKEEVKRVRDLEFTVVEDADVPESLKKIIDEKKVKPFTMSYTDTDYLYLVVGYGEQSTGGYSIAVDDLFEGEDAVYIYTRLVGPSEKDLVTTAFTYPYIVVKTEFIDKNVEYR